MVLNFSCVIFTIWHELAYTYVMMATRKDMLYYYVIPYYTINRYVSSIDKFFKLLFVNKFITFFMKYSISRYIFSATTA